MNYLLKRLPYCLGNGLELLSAFLVAKVCQDSKVFLMGKDFLSITVELSKSLEPPFEVVMCYLRWHALR